MLIRNTQPHIFRIMTAEGHDVALMPGVTDIPNADWEAVAEHPLVVKRMESGQLEEVSKRDAKELPLNSSAGMNQHNVADQTLSVDNAGFTRLTDYDDKDAVKIVKETVDLDTLRRWQDNELSSKVAHAVQAQIDKVTKQDEAG